MSQFNISVNRIFHMAVMVGVGAICAFSAHAQSDVEAQNSIQTLSVSSAPNGDVVLTVGLKKSPEIAPHNFTINTPPPRIAFDFPNTANGLGMSSQQFGQGDLRSVSVAQGGGRTRLVLNLAQMMAYDAKIDGNNLLITLQGKGGAISATTSHFSEESTSVQAHTLRNIDFHRGKNGEGRIEVDLSDTNTGIDIKQQGDKVFVDFMNTSLPEKLKRKVDVVDFGTPVNYIDTFAQGENIRMVVEPKGQWDQSAYQMDNKFILEIKPKARAEETEKKKGAIPTYSGDKLTLNFQNIAVREALSVIADFTNLNIVIGESVSGNLTLRLKDVPWDQALDIILQSKGLDMRKNGNVIQVAPREEIAAREKVALTADKEIEELEPVRTESFRLNYQKGEDFVGLITNPSQRVLSKRGSAVVDLRTNTVFVQDISSSLDEVRRIIKQIDVPVRQVMIEARFVEAGEQFNRMLGGRLNFTGPPVPAAGTATFPSGFQAPLLGGSGSLSGGGVNLPSAISTTGGMTLSLFNPLASKTLTMELLAGELDGRTKSIASPRVLTGDSTPALIESGVEIPYTLAATATSPASTSFKKAVLSLKVTPQITPDDHVNMKVDVSQDTVGALYVGATQPGVNTKRVQTQVLVDNGGTVVIGGVYTQDSNDAIQKIPLLGDVPVLGWLFKNATVSDNKKELLVFITPRIAKDSMKLN